MIVQDKLTPYEFLSQSYYAYLARPVRSTVYLVSFLALLLTMCVFAFDVPVLIALLIFVSLAACMLIYMWVLFVFFKDSKGRIPVMFEIDDKKFSMTYGDSESKISSGVSFKKGTAIWIQGRSLFMVRRPMVMGMLLPKSSGKKITNALQEHGWTTDKPSPSVLANAWFVFYVVFTCISVPILVFYS